MKLSYFLILGFFVASLSAYAIMDGDENEDSDESNESTTESNPPDATKTDAKSGDAKPATGEKSADNVKTAADAKPAADNKPAVAAAVPENPKPSDAENKANADPVKARTEESKEAVPQDNKKPEEKKPAETGKAASKSSIESNKEDSSEDNEASESQEETKEEPESNKEEASDEKAASEAKPTVAESSEESPDTNGRPDETSEQAAEGNEEDEKVKAADEEAPAKEDSENAEGCNIKYKKVGCYKSKQKGLGFQTFLKSDPDAVSFTKKGKVADKEAFNTRLPKMVCDCAKAALDAGNAVFSLKNIAECWTGPDNTIFDKEGPSKKCVTFDNQACDANSEICSGKKHSSFVYFVDTPDHTKTEEEIQKELIAEKKKKQKQAEKIAKKKANKKAGKQKKHKKGSKKHH